MTQLRTSIASFRFRQAKGTLREALVSISIFSRRPR